MHGILTVNWVSDMSDANGLPKFSEGNPFLLGLDNSVEVYEETVRYQRRCANDTVWLV